MIRSGFRRHKFHDKNYFTQKKGGEQAEPARKQLVSHKKKKNVAKKTEKWGEVAEEDTPEYMHNEHAVHSNDADWKRDSPKGYQAPYEANL
mmetsp:Transcript_5574/g.9573  ORF Transcript_5574/g.9573 Transcript_5574/m.9573 type:complete len:91 (-) Transcript_5574:546-818(-)